MFKKIHHVVIAVVDLDAATALYGKTFGLKAEAPVEVPAEGLRRVRFDVGNAFVDIAQPTSDSGELGRFVKEKGEGIYLISAQVDDLAKTVEELRAEGAQITGEAAKGGRVMVSPQTTHGALMELTE